MRRRIAAPVPDTAAWREGHALGVSAVTVPACGGGPHPGGRLQPRTAAAPADRRRHAPEPAGAGSFGHLRTDRSPDRALGASDGLLGLPMDAGGAGRLNHSSPSCLNRPAQRTDFFHGLLRPFATRTGIPLGQLRSVIQGRAGRHTTLQSIASVMGMRLFSAPAEPGGMEAPPLPPELTRALGLPSDTSVIDAVDAMDSVYTGGQPATRLRDVMQGRRASGSPTR